MGALEARLLVRRRGLTGVDIGEQEAQGDNGGDAQAGDAEGYEAIDATAAGEVKHLEVKHLVDDLAALGGVGSKEEGLAVGLHVVVAVG